MRATLKQRLVTRYAKYNALKNLIEKWLKDARSGIVEALQKGAKCPTKGPYLLELGEAKSPVSWKEEFRKHLIACGRSDEQADTFLESIADQEREMQPRLECKPNPNYGRTIEIRLPAA
jgi:hypothetical protein